MRADAVGLLEPEPDRMRFQTRAGSGISCRIHRYFVMGVGRDRLPPSTRTDPFTREETRSVQPLKDLGAKSGMAALNSKRA